VAIRHRLTQRHNTTQRGPHREPRATKNRRGVGPVQTITVGPNGVVILKGERGDFPGTHAVGHQQQQDGVVTPARLGPAVDTGQDPVGLFPGNRARDVREPVDLRPPNRRAQIAGQHAFPMGVAQKHPQHSSAVTHRALGQPRSGAFDHEGAHDRRGEVSDRVDPDPPQVGLEPVQVVSIGPYRGRT
jgi:hypothetical protein